MFTSLTLICWFSPPALKKSSRRWGVMSDIGPGDGGENCGRPARPATRDGLTMELRPPARLMSYIRRYHNHERSRLLPGFREFCVHRSFFCYICNSWKPVQTVASTTASPVGGPTSLHRSSFSVFRFLVTSHSPWKSHSLFSLPFCLILWSFWLHLHQNSRPPAVWN
jgi:hypothetical protein